MKEHILRIDHICPAETGKKFGIENVTHGTGDMGGDFFFDPIVPLDRNIESALYKFFGDKRAIINFVFAVFLGLGLCDHFWNDVKGTDPKVELGKTLDENGSQ